MNEKKFCFISCINNKAYYQEALVYINSLYVPEGYEIEILSIEEAKSLTAGYNEIMKSSDAKYKIYMHQDTFIVNKNFLFDILNVFLNDSDIGLLGLVGSERLATSGILRESSKCYGSVFENSTGISEILQFNNVDKMYQEVEAVDGFIMVTQYDIPWREDIFDGWNFYDVSQSLEFKRKGYKTVVPYQDEVWCFHDCGKVNDSNNDEYRKIFLDEYSKEIFPLVTMVVPSSALKEEFYESINRVRNQTYRNIEIIVMGNENYKEDLKDIIKNGNVILHINSEKLTEYENMDIVLGKAKGEYFYIAKHNNFMKKNKIEKMMNNMLSSQYALALNGFEFEYKDSLINYDVSVEGKEACNYIIDNFKKFMSDNVSGIVNRRFYINQIGVLKKEKFKHISDIATWMNCLLYGDLLYVYGELDEKRSENINLPWKSELIKLNECFSLIKCLKNEKIFKDTKSADKLTLKISEDFEKIINEVEGLYYEEKKKLLDGINYVKDTLINKYDSNFKYIGYNVKILKDTNFLTPEGMIIEDNVSIFESGTFMLPFGEGRIIIKNGCEVGRRVFVSATNSITIENNVIIASNVHITDHNHEYKKIGIPIMRQGVTSFTNEVVIGAGSWIANGCVIVGNIKIGRGCVIGANSVVLNDIPEYSVAVGSPAKIIKYFDKINGDWVNYCGKEKFEEYNNRLKTQRPLLTIGIITYNRASYLERCLTNIYSQIGNDNLIEVLVCDNCSTDATEKVINKFRSLYSNLNYHRNEINIGATPNLMKVLELSKGEFVNPHGDDDYFMENVIYEVVDLIYKNRNSSVLFTVPSGTKRESVSLSGLNEYINEVSYICTLISGVYLNKDGFNRIKNKNRYVYTEINQVYLQMELLKENPKFAVMKGNIFTGDSGEHKPSGYNFAEVFMKNYLDILYEYRGAGLSKEILIKEKLILLNNMILPWVNKILVEDISLELKDIIDIYDKYYCDEEYYEEKRRKIESLINGGGLS